MSFSFAGKEIVFSSGQSIAAALIAAGHLSWRTTRHGSAPRGVFCGIGVCFDCLVAVNGRPNQRACLAEAHDGDEVEPQEGTGHGHLAPSASRVAGVSPPSPALGDIGGGGRD